MPPSTLGPFNGLPRHGAMPQYSQEELYYSKPKVMTPQGGMQFFHPQPQIQGYGMPE